MSSCLTIVIAAALCAADTAAYVSIAPTQASKGGQTVLFAERKPFIAGNWKLNPETKQEAIDLAKGITDSITSSSPCDVALFVPFPFIESVQGVVGDNAIVGAECVTPEMDGAFTGATSPPMLKSLGVEWALAGHSERRQIFKESDEFINAQCRLLVEQDMNVMLCVGETLEEFEKSLVNDVCEVQLKKNLAGVSAETMLSGKVAIAYEPVWAIGTGKVATPEIAQSAHAAIRSILADIFGDAVAESTRILYGGSVSPESVDGLLAQPDIDGALVGGASLDASKFDRIINFQVAESAVAVPV